MPKLPPNSFTRRLLLRRKENPAQVRARKWKIVELLASGKPLYRICKLKGMPSVRSILRAAKTDVAFGRALDQARELYYSLMAEELVRIADSASRDFVIDFDEKGRAVQRFNPIHVQRAKLMIQTRQWILERRLRKQFGNSATVTVEGNPDNPVVLSYEERERRLQAIFASAAARLVATNAEGQVIHGTPADEDFEP